MRRVLLTAVIVSLALVSVASAQGPVGEVFASDASVHGSVTLAAGGAQVMSGSQVAAGDRPAILKLARGGTVRICPRTIVTVSSSLSGRNLLYSINKGQIEFHFDLSSEADAVQTPDYRVQFIGPGHFDLTMCANDRGELRLRGKNSNAAIIVSEMLGDGVYQAPAGSSLDFHGGSVRDVTPPDGTLCGCEEPPPLKVEPTQVEVAKKEEPPPPPQSVQLPPETHVQVDAPFVYRADELSDEIMYSLAKLGTDDSLSVKLAPTVTPPKQGAKLQAVSDTIDQKPKQQSRGFFRKIGRFFGRIFGA
ncbi:MAG TPA: hypothetical protein VFU86_16825 [Terriglobales bacterium]|nr:hypothetical protein [Terriglobales bacterium]